MRLPAQDGGASFNHDDATIFAFRWRTPRAIDASVAPCSAHAPPDVRCAAAAVRDHRGPILGARPVGADQRQRAHPDRACAGAGRSEEHTSELQSLMRSSYAVFCLKKTNKINIVEP